MTETKTSAHLLAFREDGRELLLTKRNDVPMWVIPGGHKEPKETAEEAALREFAEETGYQGEITNLVAIYESRNGRVKKLLYTGEVIGGHPTTGSETREVTWFPADDLPVGLTLYERGRIDDCLNFTGDVVHREYQIKYLKELLNQLKHPMFLMRLLCSAARRRGYQTRQTPYRHPL